MRVFPSLIYFVDPTEKFMETIIVELNMNIFFACIHYDRKIDKNYLKLGYNFQILINPAKVIFDYRNPYIFYNSKLYSIDFISKFIQIH